MAVPVPACGAGSKPLWGAHVGTPHIMRHGNRLPPAVSPGLRELCPAISNLCPVRSSSLLHVCLTAINFNACAIPFWVDVCVSLDPTPLTDIPASLVPHCPGRSVSVLGAQAQTG